VHYVYVADSPRGAYEGRNHAFTFVITIFGHYEVLRTPDLTTLYPPLQGCYASLIILCPLDLKVLPPKSRLSVIYQRQTLFSARFLRNQAT
jgi:hypothetical protein